MIEYKEKNIDNRCFKITKSKGNTNYHIDVWDSYNQEYGAFFRTVEECSKYAYDTWENETEPNKAIQSLTNAIWGCIKLDEELGLIKNNRDNLD